MSEKIYETSVVFCVFFHGKFIGVSNSKPRPLILPAFLSFLSLYSRIATSLGGKELHVNVGAFFYYIFPSLSKSFVLEISSRLLVKANRQDETRRGNC